MLKQTLLALLCMPLASALDTTYQPCKKYKSQCMKGPSTARVADADCCQPEALGVSNIGCKSKNLMATQAQGQYCYKQGMIQARWTCCYRKLSEIIGAKSSACQQLNSADQYVDDPGCCALQGKCKDGYFLQVGEQCGELGLQRTFCYAKDDMCSDLTPTDAPPAHCFIQPESQNGILKCSMDGMTEAVSKAFKLLLAVISIVVNLYGAMWPEDVQQMIHYLYDFLMNSPASLGYAMAALYFIAKEYKFGEGLCEAVSYLYYVIYILEAAISIADAEQQQENYEGSEYYALTQNQNGSST